MNLRRRRPPSEAIVLISSLRSGIESALSKKSLRLTSSAAPLREPNPQMRLPWRQGNEIAEWCDYAQPSST